MRATVCAHWGIRARVLERVWMMSRSCCSLRAFTAHSLKHISLTAFVDNCAFSAAILSTTPPETSMQKDRSIDWGWRM